MDNTQTYHNNVIKIYLSSGSVIKIGGDNNIIIPLDRVAKLEKSELGRERNGFPIKLPKPKPREHSNTPGRDFLNNSLGFFYIISVMFVIPLLINELNK
jgi:hypothetical protein